jgi:anaerobic selenocysteine-containing dehydrogenase
MPTEWKTTACILCECNCGLEIGLGGEDGRRFERIRGDKRHPASKGYTCEKPLRLDRYQNGRAERPLRPLRRRPDGGYDEIDWDTAIAEISQRLQAIGAEHGGESIFYYGGGGQGNHLHGSYARATMAAYGARFRSSALAQEKTGEFWVNAQMLGAAIVRAEFADAEVGVFVGKNPWQSHGFPHARPTLKELSRDPDRALIVIDPRRTETADLADIHLPVRPGRDAWLLTAMVAVIVQEGLESAEWLASHASGLERIREEFSGVDVAEWCDLAGVPEDLVRAAARRIAAARSAAFFEDLGVQMNRNSTLVSYLEKLVWLLTGHFAAPGSAYIPVPFVPLATARPGAALDAVVTPVTGFPVIGGLVACNVIAEEILTDHPNRFRAMIVESANPAHSLADSQRMRAALESLDLLVAIDVAMTETARLADYVLPAPTQYEKYEATFFNFEFPRNVFQLRPPVLPAPEGPLPEAEIHARLVEASGALDAGVVGRLAAAAREGREQFTAAYAEATFADRGLSRLAPVLLYRTLGPTLPEGAAPAAVLWGAAQLTAGACPDGVAGAGHESGDALFDAILDNPQGVVFADESADPEAAVWQRVRTEDGLIHLVIPELLEELGALAAGPAPGATDEWPLVLSAGERRSFTANTIIRDPEWRRRDAEGSLRISPEDAAMLGLAEGDRARLETPRGGAMVTISLDEGRRAGHVSLPNGLGVDHLDDAGRVVTGIAPNELTDSSARDRFAGTPWHKFVPARLAVLDPVP